jgi:hypothetical protein
MMANVITPMSEVYFMKLSNVDVHDLRVAAALFGTIDNDAEITAKSGCIYKVQYLRADEIKLTKTYDPNPQHGFQQKLANFLGLNEGKEFENVLNRNLNRGLIPLSHSEMECYWEERKSLAIRPEFSQLVLKGFRFNVSPNIFPDREINKQKTPFTIFCERVSLLGLPERRHIEAYTLALKAERLILPLIEEVISKQTMKDVELRIQKIIALLLESGGEQVEPTRANTAELALARKRAVFFVLIGCTQSEIRLYKRQHPKDMDNFPKIMTWLAERKKSLISLENRGIDLDKTYHEQGEKIAELESVGTPNSARKATNMRDDRRKLKDEKKVNHNVLLKQTLTHTSNDPALDAYLKKKQTVSLLDSIKEDESNESNDPPS